MRDYARIQADIDLDAVCGNIERTRALLGPGIRIMGIIKADGYGHGAVPVARVLDKLVDAYGIATVEEGMELRENGVKKPVLILGYTPPADYPELIRYRIMPTIFEPDSARELSEEAVRRKAAVPVHIKVDTGMGRIGFPVCEDSIQSVKKIRQLEGIRIDGCFTHFAKADEADKAYTRKQLACYEWFVRRLEEEGIFVPLKHVSNSAGIIDMPEANFNMVRSGISTYGLYPSGEVDKTRLMLEPAMSLRSHVVFVKEVEAGVSISYGGTCVTEKKTKVATIPVGYADGYPRALSNRWHVLIHGRRAPILGRICMDQFMVDVTDIGEVKTGDTVTLIGKDGGEQITVEQLSAAAGSFHYEMVCSIGKRVPRVYYYKGKKAGTMDFFHCSGEIFSLPGLPEL